MDKFTALFLVDAVSQRFVALKRAPVMSFAPNRYTGIGGSVEPGESYDEAALRELEEETGITHSQLTNFRQIATFTFKGGDGTYWDKGYETAYFDAVYNTEELPDCNEGDLEWIDYDQLDQFDIINDTREALDLFVESVFGKELRSQYVGEFLESGYGYTDRLILM